MSLKPLPAALIAVALTLILNGMIFAFGWNLRPGSPVRPAFAPPGWVIGLVWVVLVAGMAVAWSRLGGRAEAVRVRRGVLLLIGLCLAYPFYALAGNSPWVGLAGNLVTGCLVAVVALASLRHDRLAALLVGAVALWIAYATAIVVALLG